ncbi:uncharacterized protein LOC112456826 [Temnothorax curvispinosus]|uniref:Uncharacterized protein LOC112456826 n=1 Tax=Temnothorax curvispinosus TaxID=300111 RepID=A0A6J1Q1J7_9HYME|nr:uncharacterized protein LOC112456826 [Temnothorax curvispinosus]
MGSMRVYFALHVEKNGTILFTSVFDMDITESTGYRDFVWAVELHRLGMEMIGLWPKTDKFIKKYQWLEFRVGIILILLIIIFLPTMCTFMNVWGNMVLVIDSLHIALPMVTIIAKYVVIRWKRTDKVTVTEMYYTTIFLISLLMNTFLYCGAGELITEQSNSVHRALCDLEWYKLESRKARNLILLMIRTNHPFRVTAGKVIPLTLATFCSLLKTSSGYISFLLRKHN